MLAQRRSQICLFRAFLPKVFIFCFRRVLNIFGGYLRNSNLRLILRFPLALVGSYISGRIGSILISRSGRPLQCGCMLYVDYGPLFAV